MATLGEVRARTGLSAFRVRWYERLGLIDGVARSSGRQRRYTEAQVSRLEEIAAWRRQGLSVRDMRALLAGGDQPAARLVGLVAEIQQRVEGLQTLARAAAGGATAPAGAAPGSAPAGGVRTAAGSRARVPLARARSR